MKKLTDLFKATLILGALATFGASTFADIIIECKRSSNTCVTVIDGEGPIATFYGDIQSITFE